MADSLVRKGPGVAVGCNSGEQRGCAPLFKRMQLPAFMAQVTKRNVFYWEFSQLAECPALGQIILPLTLYLPMQLIRKVIGKQTGVKSPELPNTTAVARHGKRVLNESAGLLE